MSRSFPTPVRMHPPFRGVLHRLLLPLQAEVDLLPELLFRRAAPMEVACAGTAVVLAVTTIDGRVDDRHLVVRSMEIGQPQDPVGPAAGSSRWYRLVSAKITTPEDLAGTKYTVRLPVRITYRADGRVSDDMPAYWVALCWDPDNWKKRPVVYLPETERWVYGTKNCNCIVALGGAAIPDSEREFLVAHVAARAASLTEIGCSIGGRPGRGPIDLTESPMKASPVAGRAPGDQRPPARKRARSPKGKGRAVRPAVSNPDSGSDDFVLPPPARRGARKPAPQDKGAGRPTPEGPVPPVPPVEFPVERVAARVAELIGDSIAPEVAAGMKEVRAVCADIKTAVGATKSSVMGLEKHWDRVQKRCRCAEMAEVQEANRNLREQHSETRAVVDALRQECTQLRADLERERAGHAYTRTLLDGALRHRPAWQPAPWSCLGGGGWPFLRNSTGAIVSGIPLEPLQPGIRRPSWETLARWSPPPPGACG